MKASFLDLIRCKMLAIDVGTSKVALQTLTSNAVKSAPFFAAFETAGRGTYAAQHHFGESARRMLGRSPSTIEVVRPMVDGVIADLDAARTFLEGFMRQNVPNMRLSRTDVAVAIPWGVRAIDHRALEECLGAAGATRRNIVTSHIAALAGSLPDYTERPGVLCVDVGAGKTEIAVVSLGRTIAARSVRCGGDAMTAAIRVHLLRHHGFEIGESEAELAKITWGTVRTAQDSDSATITLSGKCRRRGVPARREFSQSELALALAGPLETILNAVSAVLEDVPPEVLSSVFDHPACLTGGAAQVDGFVEALAERFGGRVKLAPEPHLAVLRGLLRLGRSQETDDRQLSLASFRAAGRLAFPASSPSRSIA